MFGSEEYYLNLRTNNETGETTEMKLHKQLERNEGKIHGLDRVLNETTEEGYTLDIFIKKRDHDIEQWSKKGIYQWVIVFHFNDVPNPNYGFSYYIDTLMEKNKDCGLALYGDEHSISAEVMKRVIAFIQEFVDANDLPLDKENEEGKQ
tara:strand:+ start:221 stop:667 length:447 start_codon:yes stop_codon:yes gene_type:complete